MFSESLDVWPGRGFGIGGHTSTYLYDTFPRYSFDIVRVSAGNRKQLTVFWEGHIDLQGGPTDRLAFDIVAPYWSI